MSPDKRVYVLDPKKMSAETIAVTFAKTSRSPYAFDEIASELTDEKSAQFHEKWVVGYGHSSVAEHAILHIALENISRLAVENIQSNRLASYTEKSTRYQKWDLDQFHLPVEVINSDFRDIFLQTCHLLFSTYLEFLPILQSFTEKQNPRLPQEKEEEWKARLRTEYIDVCRFLLPASTLANVGMTINARALEHAIRKMLSDPLEEVQCLGLDIKKAAQKYVPTLVKYADPAPYLINTRSFLREKCVQYFPETSSSKDWCNLVSYDMDSEYRVLAAALYRHSNQNYQDIFEALKSLSANDLDNMASRIVGNIDKHDIPLRELENSHFTFDILIDQGAYYELKRHRMMTQTPQLLSAEMGYVIPASIYQAGILEKYQHVMEAAAALWEKLAGHNPHVAAYIVPNGFNRRVLLTINLRSVIHLINLRSAPNAHFSMRRLALCMAEKIRDCLPIFGKYLFASNQNNWRDIESKYFYQV